MRWTMTRTASITTKYRYLAQQHRHDDHHAVAPCSHFDDALICLPDEMQNVSKQFWYVWSGRHNQITRIEFHPILADIFITTSQSWTALTVLTCSYNTRNQHMSTPLKVGDIYCKTANNAVHVVVSTWRSLIKHSELCLWTCSWNFNTYTVVPHTNEQNLSWPRLESRGYVWRSENTVWNDGLKVGQREADDNILLEYLQFP